MAYFTATDEEFAAIKAAALKIWDSYDDTYGYASEKKKRVNEIINYADNWWTFVGMFDSTNQWKLLRSLRENGELDAERLIIKALNADGLED